MKTNNILVRAEKLWWGTRQLKFYGVLWHDDVVAVFEGILKHARQKLLLLTLWIVHSERRRRQTFTAV